MVEVLYHFTCAHGRRNIGTYGLLIPQIRHPMLGCRVTWLTTEAEPNRETTGLSNNTGLVPCNRMEYRYVVIDIASCHPWIDSAERNNAPPDAVRWLEKYGDPEHWWVTGQPVRAKLDRSWREPTNEPVSRDSEGSGGA